MPNMIYCRFRNTLADLRDCRDALSELDDYEKELDKEEADAAKKLLKLCKMLASGFLPDEDE